MLKKYILKITGMHCTSCELWLEDTVGQIEGVSSVDAKVNSNLLSLVLTSDIEIGEIVKVINEKIAPRGYSAVLEKEENVESQSIISSNHGFDSWLNPIIYASIVVGIYFLLQKLNLFGGIGESTNYLVIFFIGVVASISTCGSTVGSLALGLSANNLKDEDKTNDSAIYFFHISRIVSFILLGGLLGFLGGNILINPMLENILRIVIQVIMILLGLDLLGFDHFSKYLPRFPKVLSKNTFSISRSKAYIAPIILGFLTFFIPCGFTQSIQLLSLKSGDFMNGGLTMGAFVLGTTPAIWAISKLTEYFSRNENNVKLTFFRTAGLIVIGFAIFEILTQIIAQL